MKKHRFDLVPRGTIASDNSYAIMAREPAEGRDARGPFYLRGGLDFSSWQAVLSTVLGLAVITLVMVGIRLLVMQRVQQRRERENRQINERLRTLIAAYKTLGGSFTGDLAVDPAHLRELRVLEAAARAVVSAAPTAGDATGAGTDEVETEAEAEAEAGTEAGRPPSSDRRRRIRDAVEAALSDILLLGTEEQVRLAARAASDLAAGRPVETAELVVSLRSFIRQVLDLEPVPSGLEIPKQGPLRPGGSGSRGGGGGGGDARGGEGRGGNRAGGGGGGLGGGAAGVGGAGAVMLAGSEQDDPRQ